jgi:hypothetical protein
MKKIATLIGNCHNSGMRIFLQKSKQFRETYEFKQHANWRLIREKKSVHVEDVKAADLFIYQPLAPAYGCYSTDPRVKDSIGSLLKDNCVAISYPYTYYSALWPICQAGAGTDQANRWFGSEAIDVLRLSGAKDQEILELYNKDKIDWLYESRHNETIEILRKKESITDIKISKFIEDNFRKKDLFLIPQHPSSLVFMQKANQVLEAISMDKITVDQLIGDNDAELGDTTYQLPSNRFPIHPSAVEYYGLEFVTSYHSPGYTKEFYRQRIIEYMNMFPRDKSSDHWRNFEENYIPEDIK